GGFATRDHLRHRIEVASANLLLMFRRAISVGFGGELRFLQFRVSRHAAIAIAAREFEHAVVERMKAGQSNELKLVTHIAQLALKSCDRGGVEFRFPIK